MRSSSKVSDWGTQLLGLSFLGRTNGDIYRVLAVNNNTVVYTNGVVAGTNQAGQFFDLTNNGPVDFQSTQPIQVAQFATSDKFDGPAGQNGDPCEILLLPIGDYLQTNTVFTLTNDLVAEDFPENYINIIAAKSAISNTVVDGSTVAATNFVPIGTSGYYGAQLTVTTNGVHTVTSSQPVGVQVYGFGYDDAYGFFGGVVR